MKKNDKSKRTRKWSAKKMIILAAGICCVALVLFFALKDHNTRALTVWESGSQEELYVTQKTQKRLQTFCKEMGWDFDLLTGSQGEKYFAADGETIPDILILSSQEMEYYRTKGSFLDLSDTTLKAYKKDGFYVGEQLLGILVAENKYLALNAQSGIEKELLLEFVYRIFGKEPRT